MRWRRCLDDTLGCYRLSSVLISRFIMNLRNAGDNEFRSTQKGTIDVIGGERSRVSTVNFASSLIVGNAGASLGGSWDENHEDDSEETAARGGYWDETPGDTEYKGDEEVGVDDIADPHLQNGAAVQLDVLRYVEQL